VLLVDWQKEYDHVKWAKLVKILKGTGINWCKRRPISKLYTDQSVKLKMDHGETSSVKTGKGVR
jgi:hypothetical protein